MIYTKEKMAAIRAGIQKAGLSAPQEFFDAGIDELCEVCNGVGGSGLSNDSRLKLTRAFSFIEYSAAVHDWRYAKSDGTEEKGSKPTRNLGQICSMKFCTARRAGSGGRN